MITSFEVGAIFRIVNEASPQLTRILRQIRELSVAIDKAKLSLGELGKLAAPGLSAAVGETQALATAWREVAVSSTAASRSLAQANAAARGGVPPGLNAAGGGGRRRPPGFMTRLGGGAHVGGPGLAIPGGAHINFRGGAAAAAGLLGYGAYEAAQMEDSIFQLIYHSGVENNETNRGKFRKMLQDAMRDSGYGLHDIAESAKQEIRMFQGTPGGGIDVLPEMLRAAAIESRLKGERPEESMKALIGLAHMTKSYDPAAIKKLAPAFAFLSTANPGSLGSIERAAGYAVPLLQSGLEIDPMQTLLLGTALTRAGATSTKSGTWLREMALRAMPGTSMMSKMAFRKHEEALKALGLVDDQHKPTWFSDGKPDILKMLDIAGTNAAKIPLTERAGIERQLFGAQGGGGFALLADPAVREQVLALGKEMNSPEFKNRYSSFMSSYNSEVTSQAARAALQEFNVTMMDLGAHVLPSVNVALKNLKSILEGLRDILPGPRGDGKIGGAAATGALAGGLVGSVIPGVGTIGGAAAGGLLGATAGVLNSFPNKPLDKETDAFVRALRENAGTAPGGTPVAPSRPTPPIHLNLNIDGKALAQAVSEQQSAEMRYETSAPAYDPSSFYGP